MTGGSYSRLVFEDAMDPGPDDGEVTFDRKHRFLTAWLYELPFGQAAQGAGLRSLELTGRILASRSFGSR